MPRESVGALSSFIPDYKSCLSGLEARLGTGRKLRQPAGGFGRGFLNAPAPARSRSSSSSSAPAPARRSRSRSNSSSSGFRRGSLVGGVVVCCLTVWNLVLPTAAVVTTNNQSPPNAGDDASSTTNVRVFDPDLLLRVAQRVRETAVVPL